ncbi:MAG: hypothetical protein AB7O65_00275 [Candidatus Korobacteraceae bacterium]
MISHSQFCRLLSSRTGNGLRLVARLLAILTILTVFLTVSQTFAESIASSDGLQRRHQIADLR